MVNLPGTRVRVRVRHGRRGGRLCGLPDRGQPGEPRRARDDDPGVVHRGLLAGDQLGDDGAEDLGDGLREDDLDGHLLVEADGDALGEHACAAARRGHLVVALGQPDDLGEPVDVRRRRWVWPAGRPGRSPRSHPRRAPAPSCRRARMTVTLSRPSRSSTASNRRDEPGTSDTAPGTGGRYSSSAGGTTNTVYGAGGQAVDLVGPVDPDEAARRAGDLARSSTPRVHGAVGHDDPGRGRHRDHAGVRRTPPRRAPGPSR